MALSLGILPVLGEPLPRVLSPSKSQCPNLQILVWGKAFGFVGLPEPDW